MRAVFRVAFFWTAMVQSFILATHAQGQYRMDIPKGVAPFAGAFLLKVEVGSEFTVDGGMAYVLFGRSTALLHPNRVIAIGNSNSPHLDWDSSDISNDPYFTVFGMNGFHATSDGSRGYTVTVRGCVPHECADGRVGFALYSSLHGTTYIAHVSTKSTTAVNSKGDESYHLEGYKIKYLPEQGIPEKYLHQINGLICADRGFSKPSLLPLKCATVTTAG